MSNKYTSSPKLISDETFQNAISQAYEKGRADTINAIKNDLYNRLLEEQNKPYQDQSICEGLYFAIKRCDWYMSENKEHKYEQS